MKASWVWTGTSIVFTVDGNRYSVRQSDINYPAVAKALNEGRDGKEIVEILQKGVNPENYVDKDNLSRVVYNNGQVLLDGEPLHNLVVDKIQRLVSLNLPIGPVLKFLERLEGNPSFKAKEQLYQFLENHELTLTEDGYFLAYKSIRSDWKDKYSGKMDNSIGATVRMKRSDVNDDPNVHCHKGLHCGAWSYSGHGGWYNNPSDRVVLVKVDPKDAVSVPTDHSFQKLRVCEYYVLCEVKDKPEVQLYTDDGRPYEYEPVEFDYDPDFEEDEDDWDDSDIYDYDDEDDYDDDDKISDLDLPEAC